MNTKSSGLIGQRQERIEKLNRLRELGIDPFPAIAKRTHKANLLKEDFSVLNGQEVTVSGRLMSWREHGKLVFADLQDQSGQIQLFIREENTADFSKDLQRLGFSELSLLDVGDFIEATGTLTKTKSEEISVLVTEIKILTKAIRPLPEKWKGLQDKEQRYRRRYLDLTIDPSIRSRFERKSKFWQANRDYMKLHGFMEVETPVLEHRTGGADARPFTTHHNDLDQDFFLRISTELFQKRLIGGGFEKIFTLGPNFRNEGTSDEHLQEYYQIEWYWAYADFNDNMQFLIEMFKFIANEVYGKTKFTTRGHTFDFADTWEVIDYSKVIKEKLGVDIFNDSEESMFKVVQDRKVKLTGEINRNRIIDNLWKLIRKEISGPAFLINEPAFMSPLSKSHTSDPRLTQRFHVIIAGSELGNGYSEINDPKEQLDRFLDQEKLRESGDDEAQMLDIDYIEMLEYGMPPVSGYGMSERVFWFLEDVTAREGTLFPLMRDEVEPTTKEIYKGILREQPQPTEELLDAKVVSYGVTGSTDDNSIQTPVNESSTSTGTLNISFAGAEKLMLDNVKDPYQRHHSYMVSHVLRNYASVLAEKFGAGSDNFDPELWAVTGMIHDWDYGFDPEGHPQNNTEKLVKFGYPEIVINAILGHKPSLGHDRQSKLAQTLLATDELCGLLYAYNMYKGGYQNMDLKGVKKKYKDKAFAAKINRNDIDLGTSELGISIEDHINYVLEFLKSFDKTL